MITFAEGGMRKLQQSVNQAEWQKIEEKRHLFLKNVWGCMQRRITERMQELGAFLKQDVKGGLYITSGMFRAHIGILAPNIQETQQVSGREIMDVANDVDGRLVGNNERNIQQENC